MAGLGPTVKLTFAGDDSRLSRTIKSVEAKTTSLNARIGSIGKGVGMLAAAGSAVNVIGGVVGAVTALSGAALLVPGAALAGAAAMQTFKLATSGFGDAMSAGLTGDVEKFTEATKDMAPEMASAARAAVAFRPQVDALKKAVQGNFWGEFSGEITKLGNNYLPIMHDGLGTIAQDMGGVAFSALQAANTPFMQGAVSSILSDTAGFFREVGTAAGDVLTGIVGIGQVGATYLPGLGTGIGGVAMRFREWVTSLEGQNQIKAWIDRGIAAFQQLQGIAGNVKSVLVSVFTGLGGSVTDGLGSLYLLTDKLAEFAASQGAQQAFQAIGVAAQAAGLLMSGTFLAALNALVPIIIALSPLITTIATTLAGWAPVLGPVVVAAYGFAQALTLVQTVMGAYNAVMAIARAGTLVTVATTVGGWVAMAAGAMVNAAIVAASWLIAFWPIALVGALVIGLVALVVANWDTVKSWTISAWSAVSGAVSSAWNAIKGWVSSAVSTVSSTISSAWNSVKTATVGAWNAVKGAVQSGITGLMGFIQALPGRVLAVFRSFGTLLYDSGRSLITGLWNGISGMVGWITSKVSGVLTSIRNLFPFSPAKEGPFSGTGYTTYSGAALMQDFGRGMESSSSDVRSAASSVLGGAQGTLAGSGAAGGRSGGSGGATVTFAGNTSDALATVIMAMIRQGKIQIKAA